MCHHGNSLASLMSSETSSCFASFPLPWPLQFVPAGKSWRQLGVACLPNTETIENYY